MAMWFSILASETMISRKELDNALNALLPNFSICFFIEFLIEKRKWRRKFVILVIHINKQRFQAKSLFGCEAINEYVMMTLFLQPTRAENATDDMIG